jgi:transcriptional regulator with XRE-family HTH domain
MSSGFSDRLRTAREMRGLSQSQLAEKTGLQPSAVSHFEQSRRAPSFDNLRRLANALNVTTDYLLGRTDDPAMCGPTADKLFRNAEKMSENDLETLIAMAEALTKKSQQAKKG